MTLTFLWLDILNLTFDLALEEGLSRLWFWPNQKTDVIKINEKVYISLSFLSNF